MMFTYSSAGNPRAFWIGLNDRETHDEFVWTDGSVLGERSYQSWSRQARSRDGRFRACVAVSQTYGSKWIDQICSREFGFVCQAQAQPRRGKRRAPCRQCRDDIPRAAAVVGGSRANAGSYPWQVSLRNVSSHHICGATLIDNCWILTAAHCVTSEVYSYDPSKRVTHVMLGDYDLSTLESTERNLTFSRTIVHPNYKRAMPPLNDVALIRLTTCLSDDNPVPICLGRSRTVTRSTCKITGLGSISATEGEYPNHLQEARVPLLSPKQCYKYYKKKHWARSMVTADMICAGYDQGGVDACMGDSGGPLFCESSSSNGKLVQIGIASWGIGCAKEKYPGVYMRMESYIDWIREVTNVEF